MGLDHCFQLVFPLPLSIHCIYYREEYKKQSACSSNRKSCGLISESPWSLSWSIPIHNWEMGTLHFWQPHLGRSHICQFYLSIVWPLSNTQTFVKSTFEVASVFVWKSWSQWLSLRQYEFKVNCKLSFEWNNVLELSLARRYIWSSYDYRFKEGTIGGHRRQSWGHCHHCSRGRILLARNWMSMAFVFEGGNHSLFPTTLNAI